MCRHWNVRFTGVQESCRGARDLCLVTCLECHSTVSLNTLRRLWTGVSGRLRHNRRRALTDSFTTAC